MPEQPGTLVSGDEAKAVQELSEFGSTAVTEAGNLARYVGRILGTVPEDAVGLVLGDPLHFVRTAIAAQYDKLLTRILADRNVKPQPVTPSLAIPLIRAAYDEARPELQELWAQLIAAAMDPARAKRVRRSFIDTVQQLDPLDALSLKELFNVNNPSPSARDYLASRLGVDIDEITVSCENLERLKCFYRVQTGNVHWTVTSYGRQLVLACTV